MNRSSDKRDSNNIPATESSNEAKLDSEKKYEMSDTAEKDIPDWEKELQEELQVRFKRFHVLSYVKKETLK